MINLWRTNNINHHSIVVSLDHRSCWVSRRLERALLGRGEQKQLHAAMAADKAQIEELAAALKEAKRVVSSRDEKSGRGVHNKRRTIEVHWRADLDTGSAVR